MFTYDKLKKRIDDDKASRREPLGDGTVKGDKKGIEILFSALDEEKLKVPINRVNLTDLMDNIAISIWGFAVCGQYKQAYHYLNRLSEYRNIELLYMHDNRQN